MDMPVNVSQKYTANSNWIKNYGCAVCCGVDLASKKQSRTYTIADFNGYYQENSSGYSWSGPNGFTTSQSSMASLSEADTIRAIRDYISRGIPVACHAVGGGNEHWFVAYEYNAAGTTWATSGIMVLDPNNPDSSDYNGRRVAIWTAMQGSYVTAGVDRIRY